MKMILLTRLEADHLLFVLRECRAFAADQYDGWGVEDQCEGAIEILDHCEDTDMEIPDG